MHAADYTKIVIKCNPLLWLRTRFMGNMNMIQNGFRFFSLGTAFPSI